MSTIVPKLDFSTATPRAGSGQSHTSETPTQANTITAAMLNEYERIMYLADTVIGDYLFSTTIPDADNNLGDAIRTAYTTMDGDYVGYHYTLIPHTLTIDGESETFPLIIRSSVTEVAGSNYSQATLLLGDAAAPGLTSSLFTSIYNELSSTSRITTWFVTAGALSIVSSFTGSGANAEYVLDSSTVVIDSWHVGTNPDHAHGILQFNSDPDAPSLVISKDIYGGVEVAVTGSIQNDYSSPTGLFRAHGWTGTEDWDADITIYRVTDTDETTAILYSFIDGTAAVSTPQAPISPPLTIRKDGYIGVRNVAAPDGDRLYFADTLEATGSISAQYISKKEGIVIETNDYASGQIVVSDTDRSQSTSCSLYTPTTASNCLLGYSVACNGDYLAAGAYYTNSQYGAVYVYEYNGSNWGAGQVLVPDPAIDEACHFGFSVDMDPIRIAVGAPLTSNGGTNRGAVYIFKYAGGFWIQEDIVYPDVPEDNAYFGMYVSISNTTLVVHSYGSGPANGFYIFDLDKSTSTWSQTDRITTTGDNFGKDVKIHGDTIITYDSKVNSYTGEVYIYERSSGIWSLTHTIEGAAPGDNLGKYGIDTNGSYVAAIAIESGGYGRVDIYRKTSSGWVFDDSYTDDSGGYGDCSLRSPRFYYTRLIVGKIESSTNASVLIFDRENNEWGSAGDIKNYCCSADPGGFGGYLAIHGNTIVAGEPSDSARYNATETDELGTEYTLAGKVVVFETTKPAPFTAVYKDNWWGGWRKYSPSYNTMPSVYLGEGKVANNGCLVNVEWQDMRKMYLANNGNIVNRRGVHLPSRTISIARSISPGLIEIHVEELRQSIQMDSAWSQEAITGSDEGGCFGYSVSADSRTLLIGVPYKQDEGEAKGAGSIRYRVQDIWKTDYSDFDHSDIVVSGSLCGKCVDICGDIGAIGVPNGTHPDMSGEIPGGVLVIWDDLMYRDYNTVRVLYPPSSGQNSFGTSVATDGEWIVVGSPLEDTTEDDSGQISIYSKLGSTWWNHLEDIKAAVPHLSGQLGVSIDIDNQIIVAGSPYYDIDKGVCYIFEPDFSYQSSSWTETFSISGEAGDNLGCAVGISKDMIAIGKSGANEVDVYRNTNPGWELLATLSPSDIEAGDEFGASVAISGWNLIVGAPGEDGGTGNPVTAAGAAYLYRFDGETWSMVRKYSIGRKENNRLGTSVSISGNMIAVGAPNLNDSSEYGEVYAFTFERERINW